MLQMATSPTILDSDFKYIDKKGNLLRTRTELTIAQMLTFLEEEYQYDHKLTLKNGQEVTIDFKTKKGLIEVIDNDDDIEKYRQIKEDFPQDKVMAIGHAKYVAQIKELQDIVFYEKSPQTGSIFLEDASFSFDYAHILPLVEKCSILHGHTSSVMVELVGQMKNNLLLDFGIAKKIIKEVVNVFDHKFFINEKYLKSEDDSHYVISFDGPKGKFELKVPKDTTYLLKGEATVENLSSEIIKLLVPKMPSNVEAVGVYIYEGYNKGSHIISNISR
jgi:6-pyruvoyltetrahydropterin/6-carboxytetrahydropterin synthase